MLETSALLTLLRSIAGGGAFGQRVSVGLDSRVALCATAKGRTSATALGPVTQRIAATLIATAIQLSLHFSPTRFNVADDPTRFRRVRRALRRRAHWLKDENPAVAAGIP